jgi:hypothetical protein
LEVRLFAESDTAGAYAFQSFGIVGEGPAMTMRPDHYLDEATGTFVNHELVFTAMGTSCINCHLNGPKLKPAQLALMRTKDYQAMEGFGEFLEQMKHWSASKGLRAKTAELMKARGPVALLPLDDMLRANREHWLTIYPRYLEYLEQAAAAVLRVRYPGSGEPAFSAAPRAGPACMCHGANALCSPWVRNCNARTSSPAAALPNRYLKKV